MDYLLIAKLSYMRVKPPLTFILGPRLALFVVVYFVFLELWLDWDLLCSQFSVFFLRLLARNTYSEVEHHLAVPADCHFDHRVFVFLLFPVFKVDFIDAKTLVLIAYDIPADPIALP